MQVIPSISVRDIIDATRKCKKIYDAFFHEHKNAQKQFGSFRNELARVERTLESQHTINEWTGERYPGSDAFKKVLNECTYFIDSKKSLWDQSAKTKKFFSTILSAFDRELPRLKQELHLQRQEFSDWKIDLLLKHLYQGASLPTKSPNATGQSDTPGARRNVAESSSSSSQMAGEVQKAFSELMLYLSNYRCLPGFATAENRSSNSEAATIDRLNANLWTTISSICRLIDFPDDYRPPSIPVQRLDELLHRSRDEALQAPLRSQPVSRTRFQYCRIQILVPKYKPEKLLAASYIMAGDRCIFHNDKRQVIFEHRVPAGCCPNTFHQIFLHPHTVCFLEEQDVSIFQPPTKSIEATETTMKASIEYVFMDDKSIGNGTMSDNDERIQTRIRFQSDLWRKELLHEFHVSTIHSKNEKSANVDDVCVKLWHGTTEPFYTTLSSPARFGSSDRDRPKKLMHEWPLHWFKINERKPDSKVVQLEFLSSQSRLASASNIAKSSSANRPKKEIPSPSKGKTSTKFAPSKWIEEFGYLRLRFGSSNDASDFVTAVEEAQSATGTSPLLERHGPASSESATLSTSSSSVQTPLSPLSIRNPPTTGSRTTVGTSPRSPNSSRKTPSQKSPPQIPELELDQGAFTNLPQNASITAASENRYESAISSLPRSNSPKSFFDESLLDGSTFGYAPRDALALTIDES